MCTAFGLSMCSELALSTVTLHFAIIHWWPPMFLTTELLLPQFTERTWRFAEIFPAIWTWYWIVFPKTFKEKLVHSIVFITVFFYGQWWTKGLFQSLSSALFPDWIVTSWNVHLLKSLVQWAAFFFLDLVDCVGRWSIYPIQSFRKRCSPLAPAARLLLWKV